MLYEVIGTGAKPTVAILVNKLQPHRVMDTYYKSHLEPLGQVMLANLFNSRTKKKTPVKEIKEYLADLLPLLEIEGITTLVCTNGDYFKALAGVTKVEATLGDILPVKIYPNMEVIYCPHYSRIFYDPDKTKPKIDLALTSLVQHLTNKSSKPVGSGIIHVEAYPDNYDDINNWLQKLLDMECDLTCDIEAFSLKHYDAGIGTITFCWNQHEGIAFQVDHGKDKPDSDIRNLLCQFFEFFQHKMIYHNISYDVYVLVYQLYMKDLLDQEGMLNGLDILLKNWDCTQIISYLATNSCAGNELGLKAQAQEYAGNYAQEDIKDITKIPMKDLLTYNLTDGLATWFVHNKNYPIMVKDQQLDIYENILKPAVTDIIQMQLTGMPMDMNRVRELEKLLTGERVTAMDDMNNLPIVKTFMDQVMDEHVAKRNSLLKTKVITKADVREGTIFFNPNSPKQLSELLYSEDFLGLPILDYTATKAPATGGTTLAKLLNHTNNPEVLRLLELLVDYKAAEVINTTFLPAFLGAKQGPDGWHYLFGNFRLGGTKSGRLSSNNVNLTNLPSGGATPAKARLAKMVKQCFVPPPGWLFVGADFWSLEDRISALTTKDSNKLKIYLSGYDGHCLRALAYFGEHMKDTELVPDGAKAYRVSSGGKDIYLHSDEEIIYMGQKLLGSELFALINK